MEGRQALGVLAELSAAQWGLFTSAQAAALGVSRLDLSRLAEAALLARVCHGVYRDAGADVDEYDGLRASWLAISPTLQAHMRLQMPAEDAVVSGVSAAQLHGVGDLTEDRHEFTSRTRRQTQRKGVRIRTRTLDAADVTVRHGLPVTTIERTITDLVSDRVDLSLVAKVLGDAMRNGSVNLETLAAQLGPLAARNDYPTGDGQALLDRLLQLAGLDVTAVARNLAGIDALARPIAVDYIRSQAEQSRRIREALDAVLGSVPDLTQFAMPDLSHVVGQSNAIAKALKEQIETMRPLYEMQERFVANYQRMIEQLAPNLDAITASSRYASAIAISAGRPHNDK